jgi:hypothetical protein
MGENLKIVRVEFLTLSQPVFCYECNCVVYTSMPKPRVENSAPWANVISLFDRNL